MKPSAILLISCPDRKGLVASIADFVFLLAKGQVDFVGEPSELADDDIFTRYAGASFVT